MLPQSSHLLEGCIISVYLVVMVLVGFFFKRFNRDTSDFFRSGCRATWWMVGVSAFMSGFSAWSFTGAAGGAYLNGWSVVVLNLGNAFGFLLNFIFFAPWARQTRAITGPGVLRMRFDEKTRAFYAVAGVLLGLVYAGLHLYGLALFSSSVFGLSLWGLIGALGLVMIVYSTVGGSWAVMATDFLQGLILVPLTAALAILCLAKFGGIGGFFHAIETQGLTTQFAMIKRPSQNLAGTFTAGWACAIVVQNALGYNTLSTAGRYFAVKDGAEARKAALVGCVLFLAGSLFWAIPPITSRLLYAEIVHAMPFARPEETSYAVASMILLPKVLIGVMVVAIFASTMSSMAPGLNGSAGVVIYDLYPLICRLLKRPHRNPGEMLKSSRVVTVFLGAAIVGVALYLARGQGASLFDLMLNLGAMLGTPLGVPLFWCLFLKRTPAWSALGSAAASFIFSAAGFFSGRLWGHAWNLQTCVLVNCSAGTVFYFATIPFWRWSTPEYRAQVGEFFRLMHTPVNFAEEVGAPNDGRQLRLVGVFGLSIGSLILLLCALPAPLHEREVTAAIGAAIFALGTLMFVAGKRSSS